VFPVAVEVEVVAVEVEVVIPPGLPLLKRISFLAVDMVGISKKNFLN